LISFLLGLASAAWSLSIMELEVKTKVTAARATMIAIILKGLTANLF